MSGNGQGTVPRGRRNATVEQDLADGTYTFRLSIGGLEELQEKTGVGPLVTLRRLTSGEWMLRDLTETIRIALVGGGMKPLDALKLVRRYVVPPYLLDAVPIAVGALGAALMGVEDEKVGEGKAMPAEAKTEAPTAASPSPAFTATA